MRLRKLQRLRRALARRAGDHELHDARVASALQHCIQVMVETVVAQVGADVDELHAGSLAIRGLLPFAFVGAASAANLGPSPHRHAIAAEAAPTGIPASTRRVSFAA